MHNKQHTHILQIFKEYYNTYPKLYMKVRRELDS